MRKDALPLQSVLDLSAFVASILSGQPSPPLVREYIFHCHRLASVYLHRKAVANRLNLRLFNLTIEDLALDCIADLFERDEHKAYPRLVSFYSSVAEAAASDEECAAFTRQLVFSEVNRHLFRLYREHDPSLGKIVRNLKNAAKHLDDVSVVHLGDETWLYVLAQDKRKQLLPVIRPEVLELQLSARGHPGESLSNILRHFRDVLSSDPSCAPCFPMIGLALIVRSRVAHSYEGALEDGRSEDVFDSGDIPVLIDASVQTIKDRISGAYVQSGKLEKVSFDALFAAVRDILRGQYVENNGIEPSFYQHLRQHLVVETPLEYQQEYRVFLEYFSKLTRQELLRAVKKELG